MTSLGHVTPTYMDRGLTLSPLALLVSAQRERGKGYMKKREKKKRKEKTIFSMTILCGNLRNRESRK